MTKETKVDVILTEAIKFYADKKHIGVKDVVWAMEMGNEKVLRTIANLCALGIMTAHAVEGSR